jgi:hypothetical protein
MPQSNLPFGFLANSRWKNSPNEFAAAFLKLSYRSTKHFGAMQKAMIAYVRGCSTIAAAKAKLEADSLPVSEIRSLRNLVHIWPEKSIWDQELKKLQTIDAERQKKLRDIAAGRSLKDHVRPLASSCEVAIRNLVAKKLVEDPGGKTSNAHAKIFLNCDSDRTFNRRKRECKLKSEGRSFISNQSLIVYQERRIKKANIKAR